MPAFDYWNGATYDWPELCQDRIPEWELHLAPFRDLIDRVLEVGSMEGLSALFWIKFFDAHVTCVDNWENALQPAAVPEGLELARAAEARFDANLKDLPVRKIKAHSTLGLDFLCQQHRAGAVPGFDLVYIDGDHSRDQVMIDSCLAWCLLKPGGLIIWDDYRDYEPHLDDRPFPAIAAFCAMHQKELNQIADTGQQLICQKISE